MEEINLDLDKIDHKSLPVSLNNSSNDLVVVLNEGSSRNFRINVENSALTPLVRTTNLLLRWNTANVTDLAIALTSDGFPTPPTSDAVWRIPVTNATFSNTISKNFTLEVDLDGQIENDEEHILIIEPESPGHWAGCPESRIIRIIIPANTT